MERLTFWNSKKPGLVGMNQFNEDEKIIAAVRLLAEYEDTGLYPDEITELVQIMKTQSLTNAELIKKLDDMLSRRLENAL